MSTCISHHGEFGSHELDDLHTCTLCHVLDEDALRDEVAQLRQELAEARAERDHYRELHESVWPVLDAARRIRQRYASEVGPANEALFQPEELALIRAVDDSRVGSMWADGRLAEVAAGVWSQLAIAEAERDRLRPVVEAAEALITWWRRMGPDEPATHPMTPLALAVDAYRSSAPEPEEKP